MSARIWDLWYVVVAGVAIAIAGSACGDGPAAGDGIDAIGAELTQPNGINATHIYFGTRNLLDVDAANADAWGIFDLLGGKKVKVAAERLGGAGSVSLTVYKVTASGGRTSLKKVTGASGKASYTFLSAARGGTYLAKVTGTPKPATIAVDLTCGASDGKCTLLQQVGQTCSGIVARPCDAGLACIWDDGQCHMPDAAGTCVVPPRICTMIYNPVCGCDDRTYGNKCAAKAAGTSVLHTGACAGCAAGQQACAKDGDCPLGMDSYQCVSGCCQLTGCACPLYYDPVCGKDGKTYPNPCEAKCHGVVEDYKGACHGACTETFKACASDSECPQGYDCFGGACCLPK